MTNSGPKSTPCRSCGAEMIWIMTPTGKPMPLSVASKEKRWRVVQGIESIAASAETRGYLEDTYISHFADCPNADDFRKKHA